MTMKSQIYAAYVAGLCPNQLLLRHRPEHPRDDLPPAGAETPADSPRPPSRRKRAVLLVLTLCLAIGTWELLSRSGQAAEATARGCDTAPSARYA